MSGIVVADNEKGAISKFWCEKKAEFKSLSKM
jgi:hypothetical protein